ATSNGIIRVAGWFGGYGRMVEIQDAFGIQTIYGHLSQIRVRVGERVKRGQRLGDLGSSGYSTGPHLHYEIRVAGRHVDPIPYMKVLVRPSQARAAQAFEIMREGHIVK
ncbi:MAG: M23 family metallopeptidase, partial [Alphaproteobacteria bacterium]|nr:M23 family metallopeptidase [Alphaproteobacteria bacterium]